jgi:hypothetical protein
MILFFLFLVRKSFVSQSAIIKTKKVKIEKVKEKKIEKNRLYFRFFYACIAANKIAFWASSVDSN